MLMLSGPQLHVRCVQSGRSVLALDPPTAVSDSSSSSKKSSDFIDNQDYWQAFCMHDSSYLYTVNRDGLVEMYSLTTVNNNKNNTADATEDDDMDKEASGSASKLTASLLRSWKLNHPKKSPVRFILHHPSAQLLITAFADGSVCGWDSQKGFCTHNFKSTGSPVSHVSFGPEFQVLIGRESGVLSVYDLMMEAGEAARHFPLHVSAITFAAFLADGREPSLITAGRDRVITLSSAKDGSVIKTVPVFESVEDACLIGSNGSGSGKGLICLVGDKGCASVWNYQTGSLVASTPQLSSTEAHLIKQCFLLPEAGILVISDEFQFIQLRLTTDNAELIEVSRLMGHFGEVTDFALLPGGHLAVSSNGPEIAVFPDYSRSLHCSLLKGHSQAVIALAVCDDILVSGSRDHSLRIWTRNCNSNCNISHCNSLVLEGHTDSVSCVAICRASSQPGTYLIASASADLTVKLWHFDSTNGTCQSSWTVKAHEKEINALCFAPCSKMLISAAQDKTIRIWSVSEGKQLHCLTGHKRGVWSLSCIQGQEAMLASGSADRTVKLWRLCEDFNCVKTFEGHANSVLRVGFMNGGSQLVSAGSDGLIKIWDIKRSECLVTLDEHLDRIWALNIINDGDSIVTGDASAHIKFWKDVSEEERALELRRSDELLLKEQELQVLLLRKEFAKAVLLALSLEQPFRLYGLMEDLLRERSIEDALALVAGLLEQLPSLDELVKLLTYLREWNISYRRSFPSQILLAAILRSPSFGRLLAEKHAEVAPLMQGILPYTAKHYERTDELMIESQIVDFALLHMQ